MKKLSCILFALILTLTALTACNKGNTPTETTTQAQTTTAPDTTVKPETSTEPATDISTGSVELTQKLPVYVPGSIKLASEEELLQDDYWPFTPKYRLVYYGISSEYSALAPSSEEYKAWDEAMDKKRYDENGNLNDMNEMALVNFVKYFNIPKEDFEKAIDEQRQHEIKYEQDATAELFELPNADIIYTFDNAIINAYYLRANG